VTVFGSCDTKLKGAAVPASKMARSIAEFDANMVGGSRLRGRLK